MEALIYFLLIVAFLVFIWFRMMKSKDAHPFGVSLTTGIIAVPLFVVYGLWLVISDSSSDKADIAASATLTSSEFTSKLESSGLGYEKAVVRNDRLYVVMIPAYDGINFDYMAESIMEDAKRECRDVIKTVYIIDGRDCQIQADAVIGKRMGKAFR